MIVGNVRIGDGNWIGAHVTIGTPAQFSTKKFEFTGQPTTTISIGSRNVIREYCTVHFASVERTVIEDNCYLMAYNNVQHDSIIRSGVVLTNNVQMGGFSEIQEYANVGLSSVLHQFSTIGAHAMVGMGSVITKDVPPFSKVFGNPARLAGINTVGMARNGFTDVDITAVRRLYEGRDWNGTLSDRVRATLEQFKARVETTHRNQMLHIPRPPSDR